MNTRQRRHRFEYLDQRIERGIDALTQSTENPDGYGSSKITPGEPEAGPACVWKALALRTISRCRDELQQLCQPQRSAGNMGKFADDNDGADPRLFGVGAVGASQRTKFVQTQVRRFAISL